MRGTLGLLLAVLTAPSTALADETVQRGLSAVIAQCGDPPGPQTAPQRDRKRRDCTEPQARTYTARYRGPAHDALDLETVACFVPDASYRLLDDIIDDVHARIAQEGLGAQALQTEAGVQRISAALGDVLKARGFRLYLNTESVGDALHDRQALGEPPRRTIDCDTSALILLSVAQSFGLNASLVEMTYDSGIGHNYVRWQLASGRTLDWDTNLNAPCRSPENLPPFEGVAMTQTETGAYLLALRGMTWVSRRHNSEALADYVEAIRQDPARPLSYNNAAWLVATREFPERQTYRARALEWATRAFALEQNASRMDTLACAYAVNGDFARAREIQAQAVAAAGRDDYRARLALFRANPPRDCTGQT